MELNGCLLQILKDLLSIENPLINQQLVAAENSYNLDLGKNNFIRINQESIKINSQNIEDKIILSNKNTNEHNFNEIDNFISKIASSITGINHFGISYSCRNITTELAYYKQIISGTSLKLYEEKSDSQYNRWFFIGNLENNNPFFEIVLMESGAPVCDMWAPHFQIDINTDLDYETIAETAKSLLGDNFIKWKLDIPNYGVVLCMGIIGNINSTKITLGIGTNLRGKQILQEA
jgi:hypothetical protein